jgi:phage-related protein (TIGR01555 family)
MSQKKHARATIQNSLTDLSGILGAAATGGSTLSSYNTVAFSNNYSLVTLNRIILTYFYTGNGLFQTAVQLPIQDALAKGIKIESGELAPEDIDEILDWFEQHGVWGALENFWTWVRVYGGAALIINTDQDPTEPLNYKRLKNSPIEFYDVDRWQLSIDGTGMNNFLEYDDMTTADTFFLNGQPIDRSRLIIGQGKRAPSYVRRILRGWGMSELERMIRDIQLYLKTGDVLFEILDESKLDIYHIEGFAQKLLTAGGTQAIANRVKEANKIKSYVNGLILDKNEEFEQKQLSFGGLADVMRENRIGVASALRMPMTKLFGLSASGFSTGEADTDNYNEMVSSEIQAKMRPAIRTCIELACANLWGRVPSFRFSFPPLKTIPELDHEQIKASMTGRLLALSSAGLVPAKKVGEELAQNECISAELAAAFVDNPIPTAPVEGTTESGGIEVYRAQKEAKKNMALGEWMKQKDVKS